MWRSWGSSGPQRKERNGNQKTWTVASVQLLTSCAALPIHLTRAGLSLQTCKMAWRDTWQGGCEQSSRDLSSTTFGVTLVCSRSLSAGVSNSGFWGGTSTGLWTKRTSTTWGRDSSPFGQVGATQSCCHSQGDQWWLPTGGACPSLHSKPSSEGQNPTGSQLRSQMPLSTVIFWTRLSQLANVPRSSPRNLNL